MKLILTRLLTRLLPNSFTQWRERPAQTKPEFQAALRRLEYGDPVPRALLEMALDHAAAANERAIAKGVSAAEREWQAGAAWALSNLVQCALAPPPPTPETPRPAA